MRGEGLRLREVVRAEREAGGGGKDEDEVDDYQMNLDGF